MAKFQEMGEVISQVCLCPGIFDLTIKAPQIAAEAGCGQFVAVYSNDMAHLLPRPISLCRINRQAGTIRLVYRVAGYGTDEFSRLRAGDSVRVFGPLGTGFFLSDKKAMIIGGGIGVPPLLETAAALSRRGMRRENIQIVLGYRNECFLKEEFEQFGTVCIATEDGSTGVKGTVIDAINANRLSADVIYSCGPAPMLRALKTFSEERNITCYVSMEQRMACGIGACLACVCNSTQKDEHSQVNNKRVCADGPVFNAKDIVI